MYLADAATLKYQKIMASIGRRKEALRAVLYAYSAGAHAIVEEVEKAQSILPSGSSDDAIEARQVMLTDDYNRLFESSQGIEMLCDVLDEEELYPFGSDWPREALAILLQLLKPPKLTFEEPETDLRFRYRKGFKKALIEIAEGVEASRRRSVSLDHWLVQLLNTAFYAGAQAATRLAENAKIYYDVMRDLEDETEAWNKYPQIAAALDRQLRRETRRKTGLVSDLDL
jgi:hypothetical protein